MMMVDTINPSTSEPDAFSQAAQTPPQPSNPTADDRFYGGFDRPGEVKVNLATQSAGENSGFSNKPQQTETFPQVAVQNNPNSLDGLGGIAPDVTQTFNSPLESHMHSSYNKNTPINIRGILAIVGIGLVATIIISVVTFFIVSSNNTKNLNKQQASIDTLNKELSSLAEVPSALTLPMTDDQGTSTSTSVAPVTTDTTTQTTESTDTKPPVFNAANNTGELAG